MRTTRTLPFTAIVIALLTGGAASAASAAGAAGTADVCAVEAARAERAANIPAHLLHAIALAETGRWDETRKASFAWPWTVTSGGEGRYFPTKAEAVAEVRRLQRGGVRNIDVGCMQINLLYHGDAFDDLDDAMDPAANVEYAAGFLTGLRDTAGDWIEAAARYHSNTPGFRDRYRAKVERLWAQVRDLPVPEADAEATVAAAAPAEAPPIRPVAIDRMRTAALNARLREARATYRTESADTLHARQLALWRDAAAAGTMPRDTLALARRAQVRADTVDRLRGEEPSARQGRDADQRAAFQERRRSQLRAWRDLLPDGPS